MFRDSRVRDREVTASSFKTAYGKYTAKSEGWFDGTVASLDTRLSVIDRLTHSARTTVARLSTTESQPYLRAIAQLDTDREAVAELRSAMLNGAADYKVAAPFNRQEQDAANLSGYLGEQAQKFPAQGIDPASGDYAVKPPEQSSGGYGEPPRVTGYPEPGHPNGDPYRRVPKQWQQPQHPQRGPQSDGVSRSPVYDRFNPPGGPVGDARLSSSDNRWVALESSKFVQANLDALDDSDELATRAQHHASVQTSTFSGEHSAAVSRAFVAKVVGLGRQMYRPPVVQKTASVPVDMGADEAFWL